MDDKDFVTNALSELRAKFHSTDGQSYAEFREGLKEKLGFEVIRSNNGIVFSTELEGYITYCLRYFITKERITNVLSEVCDKLEMGLTPIPYLEDMGNPNAAPSIYSINIK